MKFGTGIPGVTLMPGSQHSWDKNVRPDEILRMAQHADSLGYDYLTVPEHLVMTTDFLANMGPRWPHAVTAIAVFAGATKRIRIATGVLVIPYHHPVEMAKSLATLDYLSNGRLIIGVGAGNNAKEFEIMNASIKRRGSATDESLAAMMELWTSENPSFNGKYVRFEGIAFDPKPIQKPYPPIWVGGSSTAALKRAARVGDGWYPASVRFGKVPEMVKFIKDQPEFQARPRPFEVITPFWETRIDAVTHKHTEMAGSVTEKQSILDQVGKLADMGTTAVTAPMPPTRSVEEYMDRLEWFASEIFPAAQG